MIINQETLKKMNNKSITYKALCCKLCTRKDLTSLYFYVYNYSYQKEISDL